MSALREIFARFGTVFDSRPLEQGERKVDGLIDRLRALGEALTGAAIVAGVTSFTQDMLHTGSELDRVARQLGLTTDELQGWQHAMQQSGLPAERFGDVMINLQERLQQASQGSGEAAEAFRQLGIRVRDENGNLLEAADALEMIATPLMELGSVSERSGILNSLMGDAGAELLPLLSRGTEGIRELRREIELYGGGANRDFIETTGEANEAIARFDVAALSLKSRLAVLLLPALTRTTDVLARVGGAFARLSDRGRLLEVTVGTLGATAVLAGQSTMIAWLRAAAPFAALAAVIGVAILLFEDIAVGIEGGRSAISDFAMEVAELARLHMGDGSLMGHVLGVWEILAGMISNVVNAVRGFFGMDPLPERHNIQEDAQSPEQAELAQQIFESRRESLGWLENLFPDDFERASALASAHQFLQNNSAEQRSSLRSAAEQRALATTGPIVAGPRVQNVTVQAQTNASPREIARAVQRALDAQNAEALDALGQDREE